MQNGGGLLHRTDDITADDLITGMGGGGKLPFSFTVQRGNLHTAGQVIAAHFLHNGIQRALNSIVNVFYQSGAKLHRKRRAGGHHLGAGAEAGGLLVDLNGGGTAVHGQDLTDEALLTDTNHIRHIGFLQAGGNHQRPGDFNDFSHGAFLPFLK